MSRVPAYLYHPEHGDKLFHSEGELDAALKDGWVDTPEKIQVTPPKSPEEMAAETGLPVEIAGLDKDGLIAWAKERFPKMTIHPAIKLETLQGKVAEALEMQNQQAQG